ncbi:MAG: monovalent cation/H(+) antiporter subunit G [Pseudomonadota bacterium]
MNEEMLINLLSLVCLSLGGFFFLVGAIGLNRMPDLFTRMHATSVGDTMGFGLLILGMCLQAGFTLVTVKLIFILAVVLFTGAVGSHALARAALHDGEKPILANDKGILAETDPCEEFPELRERLSEPLTSETVNVQVLDPTREARPSNS